VRGKEKGIIKIWALFAVFCFLFIINMGITMDISPTQRMWLILDICVLVISIILIIKNGLPSKRYILISLFFSVLVFISYLGISIFSSSKGFLVTFLSSLATLHIFEKYNNLEIKIINRKTTKAIVVSTGIGIFVGAILGTVNVLFMMSSNVPDFNITFSCFLVSLSPAIYEEMALRTFLFAFCVYLLHGNIDSKGKQFVCYFMMIIPHVMIHTPEQFIINPINGIMNILLLTLLYGLPFALLQRKRDLTSAMVAHGLVDVIRFSFFGLPF